MLCLTGSARLESASATCQVRQGNAILERSAQASSCRCGESGFGGLIFEFTDESVSDMWPPSPTMLADAIHHPFSVAAWLLVLNDSTGSDGLSQHALGIVSSEIRASRADQPSVVAAASSYLSQHFRQPFRANEVAKSLGGSGPYIARRFRSHLGCTMREHVWNLRLEEAVQNFVTSRVTLGAAAISAGFADQPQFNHHFKRRYGCSPSELKRAKSFMSVLI